MAAPQSAPLTATDVASRLGISPPTLYVWIRSGYFDVPSWKLRNRRYFDAGQVDRWLREQRKAAS